MSSFRSVGCLYEHGVRVARLGASCSRLASPPTRNLLACSSPNGRFFLALSKSLDISSLWLRRAGEFIRETALARRRPTFAVSVLNGFVVVDEVGLTIEGGVCDWTVGGDGCRGKGIEDSDGVGMLG